MKKKSHRKDVIIARIIFTLICLLFVAGLIALVLHIRGRYIQKHPQTAETQTQSGTPSQNVNPLLPPVTENPLPEEETQETEGSQISEGAGGDTAGQVVWTSTMVNLREEPSTDSKVITVLAENVKLNLLGEEQGWVKVSFNELTGYVSTDFITDTEPVTDGNSQ